MSFFHVAYLFIYQSVALERKYLQFVVFFKIFHISCTRFRIFFFEIFLPQFCKVPQKISPNKVCMFIYDVYVIIYSIIFVIYYDS